MLHVLILIFSYSLDKKVQPLEVSKSTESWLLNPGE